MASFVAEAMAGSAQGTTTNSLPITIPSASAAGNIAVLTVTSSSDTVDLTTPSGWTKLYGPSRVGTLSSGWLFYKVIASGEPNSSVPLAFTANQRCIAHMTVFSGVTATGIVAYELIDNTSASTTTLPTAPSVPALGVFLIYVDLRFGGTPAPNVTAPIAYTQGASSRVATGYGGSPELSIEAMYRIPSTGGSYGGETPSVDHNNVGVNYAVVLPDSSNAAPVVNAGTDQINIEPWTPVQLSGTATDSDGTIASVIWTQIIGTPVVSIADADTLIPTFEAPGTISGTTLTFRLSATDNSGATTFDDVSVTVYPVTERAVMGGQVVPMRIKAPVNMVVNFLATEIGDIIVTEMGDTIIVT